MGFTDQQKHEITNQIEALAGDVRDKPANWPNWAAAVRSAKSFQEKLQGHSWEASKYCTLGLCLPRPVAVGGWLSTIDLNALLRPTVVRAATFTTQEQAQRLNVSVSQQASRESAGAALTYAQQQTSPVAPVTNVLRETPAAIVETAQEAATTVKKSAAQTGGWFSDLIGGVKNLVTTGSIAPAIAPQKAVSPVQQVTIPQKTPVAVPATQVITPQKTYTPIATPEVLVATTTTIPSDTKMASQLSKLASSLSALNPAQWFQPTVVQSMDPITNRIVLSKSSNNTPLILVGVGAALILLVMMMAMKNKQYQYYSPYYGGRK